MRVPETHVRDICAAQANAQLQKKLKRENGLEKRYKNSKKEKAKKIAVETKTRTFINSLEKSTRRVG